MRSTNLLAELLERIGASALAGEELARLVSKTEGHLAELAEHPDTEARLRMALARLERGDPGCIGLARERLELRVGRGDTTRTAEARHTLDALLQRFAPRGRDRDGSLPLAQGRGRGFRANARPAQGASTRSASIPSACRPAGAAPAGRVDLGTP